MDEPFNAYYKWLGIPLKDQPPDAYRLLGLERFESDPDVISHAADARMVHIKSLSSGKNAKLTQDLLNEISGARVCLLNAEQKAQYDAALWQRMEQERASHADPGEVDDAVPADTTRLQSLLSSRALLVAGGFASGLLVLALWLWFAPIPVDQAALTEPIDAAESQPNPNESRPAVEVPPAPTAKSPGAKQGEPKDAKPAAPAAVPATPPTKTDGKLPEKAPIAEKPAAVPDKTPQVPPVSPSAMVEKPKDPGEKPKDPSEKPKDPSEKPKDPSEKPKDSEKPATKAPSDDGEKPPMAAGKHAVPAQEAQAKAERQIHEMFKAEEADPQKRSELSKRLFLLAEETKDDPVSRFVLLRLSWEMAAEVGQLNRSMEIIDRMSGLYQADGLEYKVDVLGRVAKTVGAGPQALAANQQIVESASALIDAAIRADQYELANTLLDDVALPASRKTRDKQATAELTKRKAQITRQREQASLAEKARSALASNPEHPEANLALGRWLCLVKGKWDEGLPPLAKGSDETLAGLAKRDLGAPSTAPDQVKLADDWWQLADAAAGKDKEQETCLRQRAVTWYRRALPSLSGISKQRVEKLLSESGVQIEGRPQFVLEFDGRLSYAYVPFVYDGTVPLTVEAIVRIGARGGGMATVVGNMDTSDSAGFSLSGTSGLWYFTFVESYRPSPNSSSDVTRPHRVMMSRSVPLSDRVNGEWVHVAGVYDGKQVRLYVNGQMEGSATAVGRHKPTTKYPLVLGAAPSSSSGAQPSLDNHFRGQIKAVRISSVARYTDNFKPPAQLVREDLQTQLLLVFDKGTGEEVEDTSGRKQLVPTGKGGRKKSVINSARLMQTRWVRADAEEPPKDSDTPPPRRRRADATPKPQP